MLIGGAKTKLFHLKEFGEALEKLGHDYKLVHDIEIYTGFPTRKITQSFQTLSKFNKLIEDFQPDAVFYDNQLHFGLAVLKFKIPLFMHLRGDYWSEMKSARETIYKTPHKRFALWWKMRIAEKCFRGANTIVPICKYLENIVKSHHPNKQVDVLYQGTDPSRWFPVTPMELKHPCVGLLQDANIWTKTKEMLTLTKVMEKMSDVTFYWVGDGPYRDYVLPTLTKYENFKWLGKLSYPDEVRKYLMGIDVYALISGIDMSPLTLLEAQLMKKPVVATMVGGIPELLENKKTAFLVDKGDHNTILEKLSILINDDKEARRMGEAGQSFVKENFSWEIIAKKFVNILHNKIS